MNSIDELLKINEFLQLIDDPIIEYRIYYNSAGDITSCSMQNHTSTDEYIVVTKDEYENYFRYRVKEKNLELIEIDRKYKTPVQKNVQGRPVVRNHAGLVIEPHETYDNIEYYDQ